MSKMTEDPIRLICCTCGATATSGNIYESNWNIHESNGKFINLCPKCAKIQECREEQENQIRGNPPRKVELESVQPVLQNRTQSCTSGISIRARFKLESIDVKVGDTLLSGDETPCTNEIRLPMSGDQLRIGETYFVNLK